MPHIPDPVLVGDTIIGRVITLGSSHILMFGSTSLPNEHNFRDKGSLVVRYALPYLYKPMAIVPGLFASDYGEFLVGQQGWDYVQKHFTLHPRGDILGLRIDGEQGQVMVREIDFGRPVEVYAYANADAKEPLVRLDAYWADDSSNLPAMLTRYLPAYTDA